MIVLNEFYEKLASAPLYLISNGVCHGVMRIGTPIRIDTNDFLKMQERHLMDMSTKNAMFKDKQVLFGYEIHSLQAFDHPREVNIPKHIMHPFYVKDIEFTENYVYNNSAEAGVTDTSSSNISKVQGQAFMGDRKKKKQKFSEWVNGKPNKLFLEDVTTKMQSAMLVKEAISLVNMDKPGVNILIRLREPKGTYMRREMENRICQMLPEEMRNKVNFYWGSPETEVKEFIPLFDIALLKTAELDVIQLEQQYRVIVEPFRHIPFISPAQKNMAELPAGKYGVEKYYDGIRVRLHKKGDEVKIFADNNYELTQFFDDIVKETNKMVHEDIVAEGYIVAFEGKISLGPEYIMNHLGKYMSTVLFLSDVLYYRESLVEKPWADRVRYFRNFKMSECIKHTPPLIVSETELPDSVKMMSALPGSRGAMLKPYDSRYEIGTEWIMISKGV